MNTSGMRHNTPGGNADPAQQVAQLHREGTGFWYPAMRPGRLAGGVVAAVCLAAVVSACSSAAPAPHRGAAQSQPPAAPPAPVRSAAAAPAGTAPALGAPAAPAAVPRCPDGILATVVSNYQVGGGQAGIILKLTNIGSVSCTLYGYPGLGLEDGSHHGMPSQTHWGPTYFARDPGPSLIILSPGQSATSSIAFAGGWPHKGWADFLEVTPPGSYHHAVVPLSYGTGGSGGDIHATAMARHTTIYRGAPGGCGCNP